MTQLEGIIKSLAQSSLKTSCTAFFVYAHPSIEVKTQTLLNSNGMQNAKAKDKYLYQYQF